jgi:pimeloyl-ACP methyl ester carboxylesterase
MASVPIGDAEFWENRRMAQVASEARFVTTGDGRTLCFAEWGNPDGFPVVFLHGTPGGRLNRHPDEGVYRQLGARWITYDRPGYGYSARLAGRAVVDCVSDVAAIVDHLGVDEFAVTGSSGGAPHVLAVCARMGERVVRARCNAGLAPFDAESLDFFAGMDPLNVVEFGWAVEGEARLVPEMQRQLRDLASRMAVDASQFISEEWALDPADRAVLASPDIAAQNVAITEELVRGGLWGWTDDSLAFVHPWGFGVDEVSLPVLVTYGANDVVVPAAHGEWLGRHIPHAEVIVDDGAGHLSELDKVVPMIHWLVTGERAGG